ncbi:helix-turn-helix domain-containing protein [[Brevibacterium] frigoritolerans]|nr:helix-turn-helix domain-containing protein [Peribacillus frigoritolerans]
MTDGFNELQKQQKAEDIILYTRLQLGGELMAYRALEGLSQRELSEKSKVAQKTISRIENSIDSPTLETIVLIADALGYDLKLVKRSELE